MKFTGIIPALSTPLKKDESINTDTLKKLIKYFIDKGADGFYVGGATGEGLALRQKERMILTEEALNAVSGAKPCIIQVANTDFNAAVELARHAEKSGATAISATPPIFFRYDEDDVYNYYKKLAESVHIPMMIYYSPAAGFNMNAEFAARCFEVDNITAIKWSASNYSEMMRLKDLTNGEMNIINGPDETLLMGLSAGADGGIGLTYNFMFDKFKCIYNSFMENDIETARKTQFEVCNIINALHKYKSIPATKVLLSEMGFDMGNAAFPSKQYSDIEKTTIINNMKNAGLKL